MFSQFAILDFGMPELVIILAIVLLLFGGKKLPELSKSLGESMKELRKGINGSLEDEKTENQKSEKETIA
jgi:sec-independent protein translocase protein TatA